MLIRLFLFISILSIIKPLYAHTFTGMNGFYDGLSHPVLGLDHFFAMVCVGVVSSQIGGKAIWTVPSLFVLLAPYLTSPFILQSILLSCTLIW